MRLTLTTILVALLLVPCTPSGEARADCACGGGELELVFILDASGSMNHTLNTLQEQIQRIVEALEGQVRHLRVGAVVYRTKEYNGKQKKLDTFPFTNDRKALAAFLRGQVAEGGGIEMVEEGLKATLDEMEWTRGARKVAVLLGDEQPVEAMQSRCLALAMLFKERGIVLHAVTASQTAWIYWAPANTTSWKQQLAGMGEEAKRTFRLPHYTDLAEATGGISVSSWNSKELVLWLLAFGLGLDEKEAKAKVDVDKYLEWAKQRDLAEARAGAHTAENGEADGGPGTPLLAWVKHGGEWQVPHRFEGLLAHLNARITLAGPPRIQTLGLLDPNLERYPILYLSGHGAIKWSAAERGQLASHLRRGGFLFADACCGDAEFARSLREILKELFPTAKLEQLPPEHPIYACGHRLKKIRRSAAPRTGKLEEASPELWGMSLPQPEAVPKDKPGAGGERLAVVFAPCDLGCAWSSRPLGIPCMHAEADGLALAANVLIWALTR